MKLLHFSLLTILKKTNTIRPLLIPIILCLTTQITASVSTIYDSHGTKSNGMGGTYTSIDDSSEAIYYNWAIPTSKHYLEWKFEQSNKLSTKYYNISINNPLSLKNMRIALLYSAIPNILETTLNEQNQPITTGQSFNQSLYTLFSSYTLPNKWVNIGLRHTFYYEKIYNDYGLSNQVDIALFKPIKIFNIPLNLGSTIHNISKSTIHWSTNYNDISNRIYSATISSSLLQKKLLIAFSKYYSRNNYYSSNRYGLNYYIYGNPKTNPYSSVYAGYNKNIITLGSSLNVDGWILDYTWAYYNPFSNSNTSEAINEHRLSIGKNFKPFQKIYLQKPKTTNIDPSLFIKTKKVSTIDTSIIANAQLTLDFNNNECRFFLSHINKSMEHKFNGKFVIEEINYTINLPIFWTIKPPNTNEVIMIIIEKTESNKTHISGFLSDTISLFLNNTQLTTINADQSFYQKIDTTKEKVFRLEIDILAKDLYLKN